MEIRGDRTEIMRRFKNVSSNLELLASAISRASTVNHESGSTELDDTDVRVFFEMFSRTADSHVNVARRLESLKERYANAKAQFRPPHRVTPEPVQMTSCPPKQSPWDHAIWVPKEMPYKYERPDLLIDPMPIDETLELE